MAAMIAWERIGIINKSYTVKHKELQAINV